MVAGGASADCLPSLLLTVTNGYSAYVVAGGASADCLPSPRRRAALQIRGVKVTNWKDVEGGELGEVRYFEKQKKKKKKRGAPDFGLRQPGDPDFTTMNVGTVSS